MCTAQFKVPTFIYGNLVVLPSCFVGIGLLT